MNVVQANTFSRRLKIYKLYRSAFPRRERKPFFIIMSMQKKGKTDVWYFEENGTFVGMATTINGEDLILLDYLAVEKEKRSQGFGSQILRNLQSHYSGKGLLIEIESIYHDAPGLAERKRRRQFYLSCGFKPLNILVTLFGVKMELLGYNCQLDYEDYHAFYRNYYGKFAAKRISKVTYPKP